MSEQAGRELDALVAEKVMHLKRVARIQGTTDEVVIYTDNPYFSSSVRREDLHHVQPRPYSTSIAAAWDVVERLAERGIFLRIEPGKDLCVVRTWDGVIYEDASTAPLAICLAALKAVQAP